MSPVEFEFVSKEGAGGRVKKHPTQPCRSYGANAARRRAGTGRAEGSASLGRSGSRELRAVMARNIRVETSRMAGGAGRNRRSRHTGSAEELERRIGAGKPSNPIGTSIIDQHGVVILGGAVVVDLAKNARRVIRWECSKGATRTERGLSAGGPEYGA